MRRLLRRKELQSGRRARLWARRTLLCGCTVIAALVCNLDLPRSIDSEQCTEFSTLLTTACARRNGGGGRRSGGNSRIERNDRNERNDSNDKSDQRQNDSGSSPQGNARGDGGRPAGSANNNDADNDRPRDDPNRPRTYGLDDGPRGQGGMQRPPRTVAEGLKELFKAKEPSPATAPAPAAAPAPSSGNKTKVAAPPSAPPAGKTLTPSGKPYRREATLPPPFQGSIGNTNHSTGEVLAVHLDETVAQTAQNLGFKIGVQTGTVTRLLVPEGTTAVQAKEILNWAMPKKKFALNHLYRTYHVANESLDGAALGVEPAGSASTACKGDRCLGRQLLQWDARELAGCSKAFKVGVIDTGVDHEHPALKTIKKAVILPPGRQPSPVWHGTGVLTILAGDERSGTPGLIPNAHFLLASTFFTDHMGEFALDTASLESALLLMEQNDVKVVNMSFAGPRDEVIEPLIARLSAKGMIFVAAAGNEGPNAAPSYPAAYKQVIAVTAVNKDRRVYAFANRGAHIDLAAPGVQIWTAVPGGREGYYTGTSFAAPFVTALVSTMYGKSASRQKEQILRQLRYDDLGAPGRDPVYGRGLPTAPSGCQPDALVAGMEPRPWKTIVKSPQIERPAVLPTQLR